MNVKDIRQQYRQLRRRLSPQTQIQHAELLKHNINAFLGFSNQLKIAAYIATQGEISLNPWIADNLRQQIYLPKLYETIAPQLRFAALTESTRWEKNRFNILEPDAHWGNTLHPRKLDVVLIPLVAFDRKGQRLGMGGGYYDRSLAFRLSHQKWFKPKLIGIAHSCQEHMGLPHQSWDVPLDLIITEDEIIIPEQTTN